MIRASACKVGAVGAAVVAILAVGGAGPAYANANTTLHITGGTARSSYEPGFGWGMRWCDTLVDGNHVRVYLLASSTGAVRQYGSFAPSQLCRADAGEDVLQNHYYDYFTVCTEDQCHAWSYRF